MGDKEYSPHICAQFQYGQKIQYADPLDLFEYFSYKETNLIQQCFGNFLYYEIAINNTIITDLSDISLEQSKATKHTVKQVAKLLNSLASNQNTEIQYQASEIQLDIIPTLHTFKSLRIKAGLLLSIFLVKVQPTCKTQRTSYPPST